MREYSHKEVEEKWIEEWDRRGVYRFIDDESKEKIYILDMFPYPSGAGLHVGHLKGYLATDILVRYHLMKGKVVFRPMGWDAFGLPAEQYAINTGNSPKEFTQQNIDRFREQLKRLMLVYDFERWEINTSDPEYYRHTQWIFSRMYEHGLAELSDTQVNWCNELNTVLSDEEIIVEENGKMVSERGGFSVERKTMKQWILKITKYGEELFDDIEELEWPDNIKAIQKDWIGRTYKYVYPLEGAGGEIYELHLKYASSIRKIKGIGIHQFSRLSKRLGISKENTGNKELIPGVTLRNTITNEEVYLYYMWDVGFREEELIPIMEGSEDENYDEEIEKFYLGKEKCPQKRAIYKLKDWVFSRQRFWGEPIPVLFDQEGNHLLDGVLPVTLPDKPNYRDWRDGRSPLVNDKEWIRVVRGGKEYTRETNTMPNWAGSSWYFMAYLLRKENGTYYGLDSEEAKKILNRWLPVDIYVGGQEHATMHLLYARFWHKFLRNIGVVDCKEPFRTLVNQGMVLGKDGTKMSKSKGNYVCIEEMIEKYGADTLRIYEAFSGPTQLSFKWEEDGIRGSHRWLHKVHLFFRELDSRMKRVEDDERVDRLENKLISSVEHAIPAFKVNLGVSEMMIFMNEIKELGVYTEKSLGSFVQILSLYAPAMAEEIWNEILDKGSNVMRSEWPMMNSIPEEEVKAKVFLGGKYRGEIMVGEGMEERVREMLGIGDKYEIDYNEQSKVIVVKPK